MSSNRRYGTAAITLVAAFCLSVGIVVGRHVGDSTHSRSRLDDLLVAELGTLGGTITTEQRDTWRNQHGPPDTGALAGPEVNRLLELMFYRRAEDLGQVENFRASATSVCRYVLVVDDGRARAVGRYCYEHAGDRSPYSTASIGATDP